VQTHNIAALDNPLVGRPARTEEVQIPFCGLVSDFVSDRIPEECIDFRKDDR
jgi:hypothetical protein